MIDLLKKYKEIISYGVFGVLTTLINIIVYYVSTKLLGIDYLISNVVAWILSVLFAFITNKLFVFESKEHSFKIILREGSAFVSARLFSLIFDMGIMYIGVELLLMNDVVIKVLANIIVIVLNYFLSKYWIFRKKQRGEC
ncbi:MAG: GtrA family protein [Clostridium sp.]